MEGFCLSAVPLDKRRLVSSLLIVNLTCPTRTLGWVDRIGRGRLDRIASTMVRIGMVVLTVSGTWLPRAAWAQPAPPPADVPPDSAEPAPRTSESPEPSGEPSPEKPSPEKPSPENAAPTSPEETPSQTSATKQHSANKQRSATRQGSATKKKVARDLGYEGVELFEAGRYADASERLEQAYQLQTVPTLGVWSAAALEKRGLLVEASERYVEVMRSQPTAGEPALYAEARQTAAGGYDALQPRIPRLSFEVEGADPKDVRVKLNGETLPAELLELPVPVNPGKHKVVAIYASQRQDIELSVAEAEHRDIDIEFDPKLALDKSGSGASEGFFDDVELGEAVELDTSAVPPLAWVGFGVGLVGISLGTIAGLSAKDTESALVEQCPTGVCGPDSKATLDEFERDRMISLVSWGIGLAGVAAGTVLVLTADDNSDAQVAVTAGGIRVRGRF